MKRRDAAMAHVLNTFCPSINEWSQLSEKEQEELLYLADLDLTRVTTGNAQPEGGSSNA